MPFNVQAALGLAQFHRLEELVTIQRNHYEFYRNELSELNVQFNPEPPDVFNSAWVTTMVLDRDYNVPKLEMIDRLKILGVPSRPFFYPLSSIPAFNLQEEYKDKNPRSYDISSRGINLPGAANLTNKQLKFICDNIKEVLK
tara:strand:- start:152 stop:577 length:426 start_codon:yes stop_codon:yes gene_type:complete